MADKKKVKTHIPGFDKLVDGGLPEGSNILIMGTAGTGKTIFSLQYLYNGAVDEKENGIYFTFEEKKKALVEQAMQFGWDLEKLEKKGKLKIISIGSDDIGENTVSDILEVIENTKTKRVVIDSITTLSYLTPYTISGGQATEQTIKKFLYSFLTRIKEFENVTGVFISQKDDILSNNIAQYICDGIINIEYETLGGDYSRHLTVRKMRKTKNNEDLHPMEISEKGVIVHDLE